jgi:hypothetical protein
MSLFNLSGQFLLRWAGFSSGLCDLRNVELGESGRDIAGAEGKVARMSEEAKGRLQG